MNRLRLLIRAFFGFSRTETNAFVILLPLIIILLFSEPLYRQIHQGQNPHILDIDKTDSLLATMNLIALTRTSTPLATIDTTSFYTFDPNVISEEQYVSLQLSKPVASRIIHFREKGGRFFKKGDLLKIYGMDTAWFLHVKKWIIIQNLQSKDKKIENKNQAREALDINTADSTQLMTIYGIGPVLSKRILLFREKLGGYISLDQLKEVYGLDTSVVRNIKKRFKIMSEFHPKTINLNTATLEELASHPYLNRKEAQAIITYRLQHQSYDSIEQLRKIKMLDQNWVERIRPYITIE